MKAQRSATQTAFSSGNGFGNRRKRDGREAAPLAFEIACVPVVQIPDAETVFRFGTGNRQTVTARRVSNLWGATFAFSQFDHLSRLQLPDAEARASAVSVLLARKSNARTIGRERDSSDGSNTL